jgi:hypothetical protein
MWPMVLKKSVFLNHNASTLNKIAAKNSTETAIAKMCGLSCQNNQVKKYLSAEAQGIKKGGG